ncbi:MAG TPA: hypothetical protein VK563_20075 [Puia sp.]|nr:hypothetical protein [Puia sp.]
MNQPEDARPGRTDKDHRDRGESGRASQPDNLGSFFSENKALLKEYVETRMEIYRLQSLRIFSQSAGYFAWIIVSLFVVFLILLFSGMVLGFWFSNLFHSYVKGFGLITGLLLLVFILLAVFRKSLFVNPVIQLIIQKSREEDEEE